MTTKKRSGLGRGLHEEPRDAAVAWFAAMTTLRTTPKAKAPKRTRRASRRELETRLARLRAELVKLDAQWAANVAAHKAMNRGGGGDGPKYGAVIARKNRLSKARRENLFKQAAVERELAQKTK